jgi:ribosomal protein S18 acetylase RimI-like enzyme
MMLTLRRYNDSDHDAVWNLHNLALARAGAHAGNGPWDDDLHQIADVYLERGGEFVVGFDGARLVAMGALKRTTATHGEIKRMRVHPDFQRRGYGRQILEYLEARAAALGYTVLRLDTTLQQTAAQALYTTNGYSEVGRKQWREFTIIFYEKQLSSQG